MSGSKALYRKYRPTKLADVVGQTGITSTLENSLKHGKISHAYLFIGPRGTGKTSVARILAHAVNQFDYEVEDSYLDIIEIDAASNTGVDNIRELREKAVIAPTKGKYKVYIIDEIHMLTKSASNALLKTLEEPPEHVVFIMATTDAHKVPITISSRAQVHTFKLAEPEIMQQHLRKIANQEGIKITDEALDIVVRRGGGSFRDSLSLLDQITTLTDHEITAELLNSALGLPETTMLEKLLSAYQDHNHETIITLIHELLNSGLQPEIITTELIDIIVKNPQPNLLPLLSRLPEVKPPFPEAKFLLAFLQDSTETPKIAHTEPKIASSPSEPAQRAQTAPESTSAKKALSNPTPTPKALKTALETVKTPKAPAKNAKNEPEKVPEATIATTEKNAKITDFDWQTFQESVKNANSAVGSQLAKVSQKCLNNCLHLYPTQKFTKTILEKPGNRDLLLSFLPTGFSLQIHEIGQPPVPKDPTLSQISDIMGGVQEVDGDLPF